MDMELQAVAAAQLDEAEAVANPIAPPSDVVAVLRAQNAELVRITDAAVAQANTQRERAERAEARSQPPASSVASPFVSSHEEHVEVSPTTAVATARREAVAILHGSVERLTKLASFVVDRAPVLLTLIGAYLLANDILAAPSVQQLALLAIYGAVAVAPAVYFTLRREPQ